MLNACTIIARNYLPYARVLADSFFAQHPAGSFTLLVIDDERRELAVADDRIVVKRLGDLGLDADEIHRLAAIYDVTELATAVKPRLLRCLLDAGCQEAIYLDPDICIYSPLSEAAALARAHAVVLTPHALAPFPRDDRAVDAFFILAAGVYNLGFVAVGSASQPFLDWWWEYTRREALIDVSRMMFTDQRVVDFVPGFFDHALLKHPGYNVAYWNLHERRVTSGHGGYVVNGAALRFFHFSGFDIDRPWLLSRNQGARPRILLSERPAIADLCHHYAYRIRAAGQGVDRPAYGWGALPSGAAITTRMRRLYWAALRAAEQDGTAEPPNPFAPDDADAFVAWLNAPAVDGPRTLSRYLYSIYLDRVDLQIHFRDIHGADAPRFVDWLWQVGIAPEKIPLELLPPPIGSAGVADQLVGTPRPGVNVVVDDRSDAMAGPAVRLLTSALEAAGITYTTDRIGRSSETDPAALVLGHDITIVCASAGDAPRLARDLGMAWRAGRHTIGYWLWDSPALAADLAVSCDAVDEIWAASDFAAAAFRAISRKDVRTMPLPLAMATGASPVARPDTGRPERFTFLHVVDLRADVERTNPGAVIDAFTRAFAAGAGPFLSIHTSNGLLQLNELERLRAAASDRPDIAIVDEALSDHDQHALIAACGCYVSLHRSQGLDLRLTEAMVLAKPVIATAYGGNLQFMTADNSFLVDCTPVAMPSGTAIASQASLWAEPDIEHAARLMRTVNEHRGDAATRGNRARLDLATRYSVASAGAAIAGRLRQIRQDRDSRVAVPSIPLPKETQLSTQWPGSSQPAGETIEALLPQLESLAAPRVEAGDGSRSRVRTAAQRLLLRVLRPYWFQQYQLNRFLIAALGRAVTAMHAEQQQREALDARLRELTREVAALQSELRKPHRAAGPPRPVSGTDAGRIR